MRRLLTTLLALIILAPACDEEGKKSSRKGGSDDATADTANGDVQSPVRGSDAAPLQRHTVLVIDDGFDETHAVFKGKIAGSYTIVCDEEESPDWDGKSRAEVKRLLLEEYKEADTRCNIEEGIDFDEPKELQELSRQRDEWNEKILAKSLDQSAAKYRELRRALAGAAGKRNYHGTKTAGVIAYDNPDIRLVLIQLELRKPGEKIIEKESDCPKQRNIDLWVDLHGDADVAQAYVEAPIDASTAALYEIAGKHEVTLVNLSLGVPARIKLEERYVEEGCGLLDFGPHFALEGELDERRERHRMEKNIYKHALTVVQSAGNDGVAIDSFRDSADCGNKELDFIMVGAADASGKRAPFSNYGDCVDYYSLGSEVVTAAPAGFLDVVDGTSFSAPLVVRYLSTLPPNLTPQALLARLDELADADGFLAARSYPREISFADAQKIERFALRDAKALSGSLGALGRVGRLLRLSDEARPLRGARSYLERR